MKHLMAAAAAITVMTACNGAPPNEKILTELCSDLLTGDARAEGMVREDAGTDVADFCACYAAQTVAAAEKIDLDKEILVTMTNLRSADNLNVEGAADRIESGIESGDIEGFTERQFEDLGDRFQRLSRNMYDNGGSCPSS